MHGTVVLMDVSVFDYEVDMSVDSVFTDIVEELLFLPLGVKKLNSLIDIVLVVNLYWNCVVWVVVFL